MKNRIRNAWDDPRLPIEVQTVLRNRAAVVAHAALTLLKNTDVHVCIGLVPVEVAGKKVTNVCLFVGGMMVSGLAAEIEEN